MELEKFQGYWQAGDHVITMGLSDEHLASAYQRFHREGVLDLLFYERPCSMYDFMTLFLRPETNTLGAFWENPDSMKLEMVGLGFVRDIVMVGGKFKRADVGEAFYRGFSGPHFLLKFAQMMVEYAFHGLGVDVVTGITPFPNRAACLFAQKMGFHTCGPLPGGTVWKGELASVMLSSMLKSEWVEKSPFLALQENR